MSSPSKPLKVLACPSATMILLPLEKLRVPDFEVSEKKGKQGTSVDWGIFQVRDGLFRNCMHFASQ